MHGINNPKLHRKCGTIQFDNLTDFFSVGNFSVGIKASFSRATVYNIVRETKGKLGHGFGYNDTGLIFTFSDRYEK